MKGNVILSESALADQLASYRDQAAEELLPNYQCAQEYRSAVLDNLEALHEAFSQRPLVVTSPDDPELQEQYGKFRELQLRLDEAQDVFLDAPVVSN